MSLSLAAATALLVLAGAPKAPAATKAQPAAAKTRPSRPSAQARMVMCVDGTTAREGKGACKDHGGVERTGVVPRKTKTAPTAPVPGRTQALKPAPPLPLATPAPGASGEPPAPPAKAAGAGASAASPGKR